MPSFARELETTLHNALGEASKRRHEYATLEHLLIALIDDNHASQVLTACGVNRDELKATVKQYLDSELGALVADSVPSFVQVAAEFREQRNRSRPLPRMMLRLGRRNDDPASIPINVLPAKRQHFARAAQSAVAGQGDDGSPVVVRAGFA